MKPYAKAQTIHLDEKNDRRVRLTQKQKDEVRKLYENGDTSLAKIAKMYGVSKSLIGSVTNPERARRMRQRFLDHWREYSERKGKEYHNEKVRNTRNYKYRLYKTGAISEGKENKS